MKTDEQVYAGAVALGIVAGMRCMSAPALVSQFVRRGRLSLKSSKLRFLSGAGAASSTAVLALGELIADKLPATPARTDIGPLASRIVSGALCGAVLCAAKKRSPWFGVFYGVLGALGSTFAAYHLRRSVKEILHLPDSVVALAEDAVVVSTSLLLASQLPVAAA